MRANQIPANLLLHQAAADLLATAPSSASFVCLEWASGDAIIHVGFAPPSAVLPLVSH